MNSILLSIAIGIVLALFGAMVAPFFIDWNAYRGVAEERLSLAFGQEVVINGPLDVRILPFPSLDIQNLEFRHSGAQYPLLIIPKLHANLALTPILRGRLEVTDIALQQPIVTVPIKTGGVLELPSFPAARFEREAVTISRIEISDGSFVIIDAQGKPTMTLTGLTVSGQAVSLEGPFKIEGTASNEADDYTFKVSTGRMRQDGAIRAKIEVDPVSSPRDFFLDAFVGVAEGTLALDGSFRVSQSLPDDFTAGTTVQLTDVPWNLTGEVQGPLKNLTMKGLKFDAGPEGRKVTLEGAARVQLQPTPGVEALLSSRQIDIDRVLGTPGNGEARANLGQTLEVLGEIAKLLSETDIPVELSLKTDVAILGGNLVEAIDLDVSSRDGVVEIRRAEANLPGKSSFAYTGRVDPDAASVTGKLRLDSRHTAALAQWMNLNPTRFGPLFAPGNRINLVLRTDLDVSPNGLRLTDFKTLIDDTEIFGSLAFPMSDASSTANAGVRTLEVDLTLNSLDVDKFVSFEGIEGGVDRFTRLLTEVLPGRDMTVRLQAKKFSMSGLTANGLSVDADITRSGLEFRTFSLEDLAGTTLDISGKLVGLGDVASGDITANIKSTDLRGFAEFLARLGLKHEDGTAWIVPDQAEALSPVNLTMSLKADPSEGKTITQGELSGVLAGTDLSTKMTYQGHLAAFLDGTLEGNVEIRNADSLALLSQFGLPTKARDYTSLYRDDLDPAVGLIVFEGNLNEPLSFNATLQLLSSNTVFNGNVWPGQEMSATGGVQIASDDARGLLTLFGAPVGESEVIPATIQGKVLADFAHLEFTELSGDIAENNMSGHLNVDVSGDQIHLAGRLKLDFITLPWMTSFVIGESVLTADTDWSEAPFPLDIQMPVSSKVMFEAGRLIVADELDLQDVTFSLDQNGGRVAVNAFTGQFAGGDLSGQASIAQSDGSAVLQTNFDLTDGQLKNVFGGSGDTLVAEGGYSISGEMGGSGRSWRGIVSSLSGGGAFKVTPGRIENLNPDAFSEIIEEADKDMDLEDGNVKEIFASFLQSGPFVFKGAAGEFTLTSGQVSAKSVILEDKDVQIRIASTLDLAQATLDSTWTLSANEVAAAADETVPAVIIRHTGPWQLPERTLDTTALTNYLTVRRIERDVKNLENAQAEAREREAELEAQEQAVRDAAAAEENDAPPQQQPSPTPPEPAPQVRVPTPPPAATAAPSPAPVPPPQAVPDPDPNSASQDSLQQVIENALRDSETNFGAAGSEQNSVAPAPLDLGPTNESPAFQSGGDQVPTLPPPIELGTPSSGPPPAPAASPPNVRTFPERPIISLPQRGGMRPRGWDPNSNPEGPTSGR